MTNDTRDAVSNVETEYLQINSTETWPIMYQHIRHECGNYNYTYNESKKPQNKNLNRYRDVAPYDHSRVILRRGPCDYINANFIKMERAHRHYILTQGPLPCTAGHFWLMVWEQNSRAILMLNKVIEKNQVKCHQYWPLATSPSHTMMFPDVNLKVEFVSKTQSSDYTTYTLRLTDVESMESRDISHFHYTTWPDFGVPQSPTAFLRFLAHVRGSGALDSTVGPPIVHCSAGIGRSGTFCLVDTCLILIEENGLNSVNVRDVLLEMRRSRMGLIQTPDQLRFSYAAIIEGAKRSPSDNLNLGIDLVSNHYDVVNNDLSSNSLLEDDEPPPLPPPRGDSLARSLMADVTPSSITLNENGIGPPNKPLPMEPPTASDILKTGNMNTTNDNNTHDGMVFDGPNTAETNPLSNSESDSRPHDKTELRHRHQNEKKERMAAQVREMKRRQKQSEDWKKLKRSLFMPVTIGIGTVLIGGGVFAIYGYYYARG